MLNIRYLLTAFISSGISITCFNHVNKSHIKTMNSELGKLHEENKKLRKEADTCPTAKSIITEIDKCLTILMKEIIEDKIDLQDDDLKNEIHIMCNLIIRAIPKPQLKLEEEEEEEEAEEEEEEEEEDKLPPLEREKNNSSDSLSSSDSFDKISTGEESNN
jgi:hypothetical protein